MWILLQLHQNCFQWIVNNCDEKCYCVGECSFCSKDFDCAGECQCFFVFFDTFHFVKLFLDLLCFCGTFLFIKLWPKINLRPLSFVIICAKRSYFGNSESGRENSICSMIYDWNEEFNWQNLLAKILFAITITLLSSYWNYCQHIAWSGRLHLHKYSLETGMKSV